MSRRLCAALMKAARAPARSGSGKWKAEALSPALARGGDEMTSDDGAQQRQAARAGAPRARRQKTASMRAFRRRREAGTEKAAGGRGRAWSRCGAAARTAVRRSSRWNGSNAKAARGAGGAPAGRVQAVEAARRRAPPSPARRAPRAGEVLRARRRRERRCCRRAQVPLPPPGRGERSLARRAARGGATTPEKRQSRRAEGRHGENVAVRGVGGKEEGERYIE